MKKTEENKGAPFRKDDGESKFQENGGLPETLVCCCPFLMILHRFWPAVWGSRSQPKAPEEILQQIVKKIKEKVTILSGRAGRERLLADTEETGPA